MTFKTYEINVDLINDISTNTIRFSQNDRNSAKLLLSITNKGAELDLSQAKSVRMSFKKSDGTRVFQNDCQPINAMKGKYQILLKTQTLASIGNVIAQIHIEEEDRILDTQKFFFVVNESLSGDGAIESTNEFSIIKAAIEAGKKLEGKDIDGIITAGELAKGALPKAGGTMTGALVMDGSKVTLKNKEGTGEIDIAVGSDGALWITDKKTNKTVATIKDGFLDVRDTNLLKKAGDTMSGALNVNAPFFINSKDGKKQYSFETDANGKLWFSDKNTPRDVFTVEADGTFRVAGSTNLLKKTGDTMTGGLTLDRANASTYRELIWSTGGVNDILLGQDSAGNWRAYDVAAGAGTIFKYDKATKRFTVDATNSNLVTKNKDDRVTIPVTADAELITSYGVISDRRGNTVTLRAPVRRKVGSTNGHVFTLPPGMRPTMMLTQVVHASDGTPALMTIPSDTGQVLLQTITPAIMGKDYHIVLTYVVD